jgi:hypothetical protein
MEPSSAKKVGALSNLKPNSIVLAPYSILPVMYASWLFQLKPEEVSRDKPRFQLINGRIASVS